MPKGESEYAHVEVDFFSDSRVQQMTDRSKLGYLAWWFTAIKERREVLLPHQSEPSKLAVRTGISLRAVKEGLASGQKTPGAPLIIVYETGHVRVCGVRKKHANLKNWHDQDDQELAGRLAPKSPDQWGQTRASSRAVPSRAETERSSPPNAPEKTPSALAAENPNNPFHCWQKTHPVLRQADIAMIQSLWDKHRDVDVCRAMETALSQGKTLGFVHWLLNAGKRVIEGQTSLPEEVGPPGWTRKQDGKYFDAQGNELQVGARPAKAPIPRAAAMISTIGKKV